MCNGRKARIQVKRSLNFKGCHGHARGDPQLKLQGYPQTVIAEKLNIDRKTVWKYWKMSEERFRERRQSYLCREKSFASYKDEILEIYKNNDFERLPMSSVYDYLEELYDELPGTEKTLRNYIHYLYMTNQLDPSSTVGPCLEMLSCCVVRTFF